jgi:hypothetical protein
MCLRAKPATGGGIVGGGGGGYTPQQRIILNGAQQMMPIIQQGIQELLWGNPQEAAARRAAEAQAAELARQRKAEEDARRAAAIKGGLIGRTSEPAADSKPLKVDSTGTPFFGTNVATPTLATPSDSGIIRLDSTASSGGGAGLTTGQPDGKADNTSKQTCSAKYPNGSMSEPYTCTDTAYVPMCLRPAVQQSASTNSKSTQGIPQKQERPASATAKPAGGDDEKASASARAPFDTALRPTGSAADQLCEAAGLPSGCISSSSSVPERTGGGTPSGTVPLAMASAASGVVSLQSTRRVCGVDVAVNGAQTVAGADPARASGFPIAGTLDELRSMDYSDIRANLAAMTPLQLAEMRLAAQQQAARSAVTIEGLKKKLFVAGLSAAIPIESFSAVAKAAMLEAVKEATPFGKTMERLGGQEGWQEENAARLKLLEEYADHGGKIVGGGESMRKWLDRLSGLVEPKPKLTGMAKFTFGYYDLIFHGMLAVDAAQNQKWGEASEHAGKALWLYRPVADMYFSREALVMLGKADAPVTASIVAVDLLSKYELRALDKKQAVDRKAAGRELTLALTASVDGLKGKQRDLENLLRLMAEDQRCR